MRPKVWIALGLALALTGCGSLGRLETKAGRAPESIRDYDRVIVADFAANDTRPAKDAAEAAERATRIEAGRQAFTARLVEEIRATGAFGEVAQAKLVDHERGCVRDVEEQRAEVQCARQRQPQ